VSERANLKQVGREDLSYSPILTNIATFCLASELVKKFTVVRKWVRKEPRHNWKISYKQDTSGVMVTLVCAAGKTRMHLKCVNPTAVEIELQKIFQEFMLKPR